MRIYKGLDGIDWDSLERECEQEGNMKKYWLERFIALRDEHSDELPELEMKEFLGYNELHPMWYKYKCSAAYIIGLSGELVLGAIRDGVITDKSLRQRIRCFEKYKFNFGKGLFTSPEEIDLINIILTDVINHLSEK